MKHRADTLERARLMRTSGAAIALPASASSGWSPPDRDAGGGRHARQPVPAPAIPATVRWRARRLSRTLLTCLAAAALLVAMPTAAYFFWRAPSADRMQVLLGMITLDMGLSMLLAARRPLEVTLRGSLLTVTDHEVVQTFDLADALQRVVLSGDPHQRSWTLTLAREDDRDLVLGRRDVDAVQLDPIVRYHRDVAERRLDRQWAMLGL
jgi:hypothetical protein